MKSLLEVAIEQQKTYLTQNLHYAGVELSNPLYQQIIDYCDIEAILSLNIGNTLKIGLIHDAGALQGLIDAYLAMPV